MRHDRIAKREAAKGVPGEKHRRLNALFFLIVFGAVVIVVRLGYLQIVSHDEYVALAQGQYLRKQEIAAHRGEIFLQDEYEPYPLAVNRELMTAIAVPKEIKDPTGAAEKLSQILGLERADLERRLDNPGDAYELLKRKLSDDEARGVREAQISGIHLEPENYRYYPGGELAAQLVGFVGSSGETTRGMYGLESSMEDLLKGESGEIYQSGDARGRWISTTDREVMPARNGTDLVLTVNHTVQYEVEKILKESIERFAADSGTVVVTEAKTGRILAVANAPSFNPNEFSKTEDMSLFINPAVAMPYESGSVFKTFTEAIGMDDGKISPDTTYVDTGVVKEAGFEINNSDHKAYGVQTMTQVLENSLNTGVVHIEQLVGNKKFADYVKRFGFGEKTGVNLPNELAGNIRNISDYRRDINFFTASYGQGITVTPLQLAAAYGALANDGMLMKPQIVQSMRHGDGRQEEIKPQEVRQVVSEKTARLTGQMLRSVVVNGHGKKADVPGYLVGGKTGTAQVAKEGSKGYEEGVNIGSFAGYAPINDPRFVIVVKLVNPKNVEWAESSAAPTFGKVMKFLLNYYKVAPTENPEDSHMYGKEYIVPLEQQVPEPEPVQKKKDDKKQEAKDKKR